MDSYEGEQHSRVEHFKLLDCCRKDLLTPPHNELTQTRFLIKQLLLFAPRQSCPSYQWFNQRSAVGVNFCWEKSCMLLSQIKNLQVNFNILQKCSRAEKKRVNSEEKLRANMEDWSRMIAILTVFWSSIFWNRKNYGGRKGKQFLLHSFAEHYVEFHHYLFISSEVWIFTFLTCQITGGQQLFIHLCSFFFLFMSVVFSFLGTKTWIWSQ